MEFKEHVIQGRQLTPLELHFQQEVERMWYTWSELPADPLRMMKQSPLE